MATKTCVTAGFLLLVIGALAGVCSGFSCRTCSYSSNTDRDDVCVIDPASLTGLRFTYHCNRTCTIQENYSLEERKITSLQRTCSPVEKSGYCVQDTWHIICFYSCVGELCNDFVGELHAMFPIRNQGNRPTPSVNDVDNNGSSRAQGVSGLVVPVFLLVLIAIHRIW